ncbi:CsbD family protein [Synechococcus sp. CS-1329]|uniref:CsbD family protein n=1 Tax=Synechococcus sp. CS-1329 TaxID=2847975 RepID=UPI00223C31D7|nr:CsbD family protein [Synechococcus sp. CS-1329]MCT0218612.1 CsbD family protein [Synechococcus sp. CS-1329]
MSIASLMALAVMRFTMLIPLTGPAMAITPLPHPIAFATMSSKMDAASKDAEGKAKQVQASAMNTAESLKKGAQSVAKDIRDAAG